MLSKPWAELYNVLILGEVLCTISNMFALLI